MRARTLGLAMIGASFIAFARGAVAQKSQPLFIKQSPDSFEDVKKVVEQQIPDTLDQVQCGGWNPEVKVTEDPGSPNVIARVDGVPGRRAKPLGVVDSGMAERVNEGGVYNDGFLFPNSTDGLSTTCEKEYTENEKSMITKEVWDPREKAYVKKTFQHPYFSDPPCLWRIKPESQWKRTSIAKEDGAQELEPGEAGKAGESESKGDFKQIDPPHTKARCDEFVNELNTYKYKDWRRLQLGDEACEECERYICTDAWVPGSCVNKCSCPVLPAGVAAGGDAAQPAAAAPVLDRGAEQAPVATPPSATGVDCVVDPISLAPTCVEVDYVSGYADMAACQAACDASASGGGGESLTARIGRELRGFMAGAARTKGSELAAQAGPPGNADAGPNWCIKVLPTAAASTGDPNAKGCSGMGCRCAGLCTMRSSGPGVIVLFGGEQLAEVSGGEMGNPRAYRSFYRHYGQAYYERAKVPDAEDDQNSRSAAVACYGFYDEYDPKYRVTQPKDRRCMIKIDLKEFYDKQMAKGKYKTDDWPDDADPKLASQQRYGGGFDVENDLWYTKLGRAFSFLNMKVYNDEEKPYKGKLARAVKDVDKDVAQQRATVQKKGDPGSRPYQDQPELYAKSRFLRDFDDTGSGLVVRWWHEQEQAIRVLLHRRRLKMLLPESFVHELDPDLLEDPATIIEQLPGDPRSKILSVQLDLDAGVLGEVLTSLRSSLQLRIEEEPIPVFIPDVSPLELTARATQWCNEYRTEPPDDDAGEDPFACEEAPQDVQDKIARLGRYAQQFDDVRRLRSGIAEYVGKLREMQFVINNPLNDWIRSNLDQIREIAKNSAEWDEIDSLWRSAHDEMAQVHSNVNMPWCMNQRFTTPIYSLLDPWWRRSFYPYVMALDNPTLRDLAQYPPTINDLELRANFSTLIGAKDALHMPVLKPHVIHLNIPAIPEEMELSDFPENPPPVDEILAALRESAESLAYGGNEPPPRTLETVDLGDEMTFAGDLRSKIAEVRQVVSDMKKLYQDFWNSLVAFDGERVKEKPFCMKKNDLSELQCCGWDRYPYPSVRNDPCFHVEMELMQTLVRVGSRPGVNLEQDYDSTGKQVGVGNGCTSLDRTCDVMAEGGTWQGVATMETRTTGDPDPEDAIGTLRKAINDLMLPDPVGSVGEDELPPYGVEWEDLLPALDSAQPIDLSIPASSAPSRN